LSILWHIRPDIIYLQPSRGTPVVSGPDMVEAQSDLPHARPAAAKSVSEDSIFLLAARRWRFILYLGVRER